MIEWLSPYIRPARQNGFGSLALISLGGSLDLENTKSLSEVLELQPSQWLRQYISYLFLYCNIPELHYSPLHNIPHIVILDLDVLRLVMEHWIL